MSLGLEGLLRCLRFFFSFPFFFTNSGCLLWIKRLWKFTLSALPGCSLPSQAWMIQILLQNCFKQRLSFSWAFFFFFFLRATTEPAAANSLLKEGTNSVPHTFETLNSILDESYFCHWFLFSFIQIFTKDCPLQTRYSWETESGTLSSVISDDRALIRVIQPEGAETGGKENENFNLPKVRTAGIWKQYVRENKDLIGMM